jgi:hypothetical protein
MHGTHFVEVQDRLLLVQDQMRYDSRVLADFNKELQAHTNEKPLKIGIIYLGRQAPGGNNIIDGLLRFQ